MKKISLVSVLVLCSAIACFAQDKGLLIDDFEGPLTGGEKGTVDFGAGNGSSLDVSAATDIKYSGAQSLKASYDALAGGYMWAARGLGLDAKNSSWLVKPENIDWKKYGAFSFYLYGNDSKTKLAVDIKDSGNEIWRFQVTDDFKGWKQIVCPFLEFLARDDWQPESAEKNVTLDFPIKSFQFEPLPEAKGVFYFDEVSLIKK